MKVLQRMESIRGRFFSGVDLNSKKSILVKWSNILCSKKKGGLGVSSLYALNRALMCKWVWRFKTHKTLLWTRVIKAIHGEDGMNGSGFKISYKSIWRSILQEMETLKTKDMVLKQRYPRLYALEENKKVDVASKLLQESLSWSFRRAPRSGVEQAQLTDLTTYVEGVVLGNSRDRWILEVSTQTRWIKAVPIKVNIHAWKVRLDCLPTRLNISRRGIDIPSILCPVCGSVTESSSHLFFDCHVAKDNFRKICRWWEVDFMEVHTFDEWNSWIANLWMPIKHKILLEGFMMLRFVHNPSPNHPFIFDIDGRSLEFGREDFCLITGFLFGKYKLDPKEEDHSEFCKRVFPKIDNLKGEHLLKLLNEDVKFNQLDDEDVVRVCLLLALDYVFMGHDLRHMWALETFSNSIHWWRKDENVIPCGVAWSNGLKFEKSFVLAQTVKDQQQMIVDLQRRLLSVEQVTKKLRTGPSDVDHLDKNGNQYDNVPVGGLDHQSMNGTVKEVDESVAIDGLIRLRSQDVDHTSKESIVVDDNNFKDKDNEEAYFLTTQQVIDLVEEIFIDTPSGPDSTQVKNVKDVVESDIKTVVVPFQRQKFPGKVLVSPYVPLQSTEVKFKKRRRERKLNKSKRVIKTIFDSDGNEIKLLPWTEDLTRSPNAPKRTVTVPEHIMSLFRDKNRMEFKWTFPWGEDGHVVQMDFWEKLVGRSHAKRGWLSSDHLELWIDYLWQFREPDDDWAMASPYLSDMLSWLPQKIPLEVDDPIDFALAYRERMIEFYWKYKMFMMSFAFFISSPHSILRYAILFEVDALPPSCLTSSIRFTLSLAALVTSWQRRYGTAGLCAVEHWKIMKHVRYICLLRKVENKLHLLGDEWENFTRDNLNSSVRTLHFAKEGDDTFYVTGYNRDIIEWKGYDQLVVGD
ncbi:RNA-directed DNA polymerase, eukaryota, reverse transcriptase zinc-binding domain protein [Tanacetum coccineum]|uniref:RNA-directed DNA polymerase, eukaryota, reverse transcriptase zinc-binding domain protein n=1 Tax=Tanacetum coccineum TaxID=301880 RepID=A0ABQ4WY03_9ASTR